MPEWLIGVVGLVLGSGGVWAYFTAKVQSKPDIIKLSQQIATDTIAGLDERLKAQEDRIAALSEQVEALTGHINTLEQVIRDLGRQPPPRPTKGAKT